MCNYFSDYKITNSNNIDKLKKLESWELAIGLNEVDNLKPSEYLIELTKDSIDNNKTYNKIYISDGIFSLLNNLFNLDFDSILYLLRIQMIIL